MIVEKAVKMANLMDVPVLGLIENMSYVKCPDCGREIPIFGESHAGEISERLGVPLLARLPVDPSFASLCDRGSIELYENDAVEKVADRIEEILPVTANQ